MATAASTPPNPSTPVGLSTPQQPTTPLQPPHLQQPPFPHSSHGKKQNISDQLTCNCSKVQQDPSVVGSKDSSGSQVSLDGFSGAPPAKRKRAIHDVSVDEQVDSVKDGEEERNNSNQLTHTRSKVQQDPSAVKNKDSSESQAPLDGSSDAPPAKRKRVIHEVSVDEHVDSVKDEQDSVQKDLEIVEFNEIFADEEFCHTKVVMHHKSQIFYATIKARVESKNEIDTSQLDKHAIPRAHIFPILPTQASISLSPDIFIKRPSLIFYADSKNLTEISRLFMHEAQMCERIKKSPHRNIARYFGCLLEHNSISGLCFKKYGKTMNEMVKSGISFDRNMCLSDIKAGIEHLHSLGIIHCDINPHNVLLDGSNFVVADFDSCTLEGDELEMKAGTDGWTEDEFVLAQRENDWFGFEKIENFLLRKGARK